MVGVDASLGRILIVDDDVPLAELLSGSLTDQGYETILAHHGADGLMLAEVERPDVVLLDVRMPGLNGVEVLQQMRTRWPYLAVIMISGLGDTELARAMLRRGAFDYLSKPLDLEHLHRCVAAALGAKRPTRHSATA
ncbi:MAG TPA: response regulator [Methylomirabilota bacterium]|nr:response regulator [Methylomirabilota bacterium]